MGNDYYYIRATDLTFSNVDICYTDNIYTINNSFTVSGLMTFNCNCIPKKKGFLDLDFNKY